MKLILVGGFLGAGKTTLLWEAALRLTLRDESAGLITNDQAPDLVDTSILTRTGAGVREVAGSCFCCNFIGFHHAVKSLVKDGATCILAEPVGSCTDLSATILQPMKDRYAEFRVAPLTVLVDPRRAREIFQEARPLLHSDAAYILRVQLEEADHVLLTKADTLSFQERWALLDCLRSALPEKPVQAISTLTGEGIDAWLNVVLGEAPGGTRIVEVDYDRYANGEAVLGWLNAVATIRETGPAPDWHAFLKRFLESLQSTLKAVGAEVGHVKALVTFPDGHVIGNLTSIEDEPRLRVEGDLGVKAATLTINARAQTTPDQLDFIVRGALGDAAGDGVAVVFETLHCLQPGRPTPTHRYEMVVSSIGGAETADGA